MSLELLRAKSVFACIRPGSFDILDLINRPCWYRVCNTSHDFRFDLDGQLRKTSLAKNGKFPGKFKLRWFTLLGNRLRYYGVGSN